MKSSLINASKNYKENEQEKYSYKKAYDQELINAPPAVPWCRINQFSHKPRDADSH